MNQERQKTDAIADAVEIPKGATHVDQIGYYFHKTDDGYFVYSKTGWGWSTKPFNFTESEIRIYGIKPL